ncbi:MAG: GGDEF domain-containing protein [Gammaproteobacteria bacterium]|nr:GGDEF domain-containing protein [Gammaproteobacteria bacterium]
MVSLSIGKNSLRRILLIGCVLMAVFIFIDLRIIPAVLHNDYLISRLGFQIPAVFLLYLFTFHTRFEDFRQIGLLLCILVVTLANYWIIQQSWLGAKFVFSYEGTLLYTFFAFFILRIKFKFGLIYVALSLLGFGVLVLSYPIYGMYNSVNFGFIAMAQIICLYGLYTLNNSLNKVDDLTAKLQELSRVDQLTGLLNRRAYEHDGAIVYEHAKRLQIALSVFMIDIDNFKDYNDAYGHQKGDEVIAIQANILKSIFKRQSDIIGRFGGEEFIVITSNLTENVAERMAQRVLDSWMAELIPHGKGAGGVYVSCSIGIVSVVPSDNTTLKKFIGMADTALFEAKAAGRNRYKSTTL